MANLVMKGVIRIHVLEDNIVPAGVPVRVCKIRFLGTASGQGLALADAGGVFPGKWGVNPDSLNMPHDSEFNPPLVFNGLRSLSSGASFGSGGGARAYLYTV